MSNANDGKIVSFLQVRDFSKVTDDPLLGIFCDILHWSPLMGDDIEANLIWRLEDGPKQNDIWDTGVILKTIVGVHDDSAAAIAALVKQLQSAYEENDRRSNTAVVSISEAIDAGTFYGPNTLTVVLGSHPVAHAIRVWSE